MAFDGITVSCLRKELSDKLTGGRITKIVPVELAQPRARSSQDFLHYRAEILRLLHYGGTIQEPDYYL